MNALRLIGLGWYVVVCIVGGVLAGVWVDKIAGVTPLFTLLGLFAGLGFAFYGVYQLVKTTIGGDKTDGGVSE